MSAKQRQADAVHGSTTQVPDASHPIDGRPPRPGRTLSTQPEKSIHRFEVLPHAELTTPNASLTPAGPKANAEPMGRSFSPKA